MTYTIEHSNGDEFVLLPREENVTRTSLTLIGQGSVNYGTGVAQNFVRLLENFAHDTEPDYPIVGQLWYNPTENFLQIYAGEESGWTGANGLKVADNANGTCTVEGELLFDTSENRLHICDGTKYVPVSPPFVSGSSTGFSVVTDTGNHVFLIVSNGNVLGVWSDTAFDPSNTPHTISIGGDEITIVLSSLFTNRIGAGLTLADKKLLNNGTYEDLELKFHGKATSAEYSDLAERYQTDITVEPGDLVKIGGSFEITKTRSFKDPDVFGVISTEPAIMMNSSAGSDSTHPYVALSGRVPCKVKGFAKRGDRLVSSSIPGVAEAISNKQDIDFYTIFGRVLQDKMSEGIEVVEVIVGVK